MLCELAIQHRSSAVKLAVLDGDSGVQKFLEPRGVVIAEQLFRDDRRRVHRRDVEQRDIPVHAGLGVDVTAFADLFAAVSRLAALVPVARKQRPAFGVKLRIIAALGLLNAHEAVVELTLRVAVGAEDDPLGQAVRGGIDVHASHIGQNLPGDPIALSRFEHGFSRADVVFAVFRDEIPLVLRHGLIPRKAQFLMMNAQLNLELLERLFCRREIVDVGIRNIVGLAERDLHALSAFDDGAAQLIQLLVGISEVAAVEDVVVVPAAVESDQPLLHQFLDLGRRGVDHAVAFIGAALLPDDQEEVRKDLDVEECDPVLRPGIRIA